MPDRDEFHLPKALFGAWAGRGRVAAGRTLLTAETSGLRLSQELSVGFNRARLALREETTGKLLLPSSVPVFQ